MGNCAVNKQARRSEEAFLRFGDRSRKVAAVMILKRRGVGGGRDEDDYESVALVWMAFVLVVQPRSLSDFEYKWSKDPYLLCLT